MTIFRLTNLTPEIAQQLSQLLPQLNDKIVLSRQVAQNTLSQPNVYVFVAQDEDQIIGMLTLVHYSLFSGEKAWIEDVVVDVAARGKGVGKQLVEKAVFYAKQQGWQKIDLTSRPERVAANKLYKKMGFQLRETNLYRLETIA